MAGGSEEPTASLKMSARARAPRPAAEPEPDTTKLDAAGSAATSIGSPIEALERDEILRTRAFTYLVMLLATIGAITPFVLPGGHPVAKQVMFAACGLGFLSMFVLLYQTGDPVRFRQRLTSLIWFCPAISVNAAVFYFGVYSPAPMLVVLGIYFVGLGKAGRMALAAYLICAVLHAAMATGVIVTGRDIGIVHPDLTQTQMIIIQVLQQFVLALTYVVARLSRRTALVAVGELEQAVRLAAHRQALLLEARDELERALRTKRGRFSEQTIGTYRLGDVLGRGAMGEVYDAVDTRTSTRVAIKLLSQASLGNANLVLRFFRELRTAAAVDSPHVVRVIEVGEKPVPFLVMERLDGVTLSELLRQRRTLAPAEVVELVEEVGIGIAAAAAAGIVHRDLKPQNVFRHEGREWYVLDLGVARAIDQGDTLTAGQVVGTPSYMAPEQASSGEVDHRSDLYALAAIAYRAFTGHPPFAAADVAETLYRVVHTRPLRPGLLAPELPADVDVVLAIGMAARPADRFATAAELASALRDAVAGQLDPLVRTRGSALVQAGAWSSSLKPPRRP
jgi:serine/threonine-protein kinase